MTNKKQKQYIVKILEIEQLTPDVKRFTIEKPMNYKFTPGQATEVSVNHKTWENEKRPFTFTSLNSDKHLEFTIKEYPKHNGVTKEIHSLKPGEELVIGKPWGAINYRGHGVFIAGGAGITPFIAILRQLKKDNKIESNKLIFSNKTKEDIILEDEFKNKIFKHKPEKLVLTLTRDNNPKYEHERINKEFLEKNIAHFNQNFYVCGPSKFVQDITNELKELGAIPQGIVIED
ncbi:MAG: FAD-binding oxidoreductase [Nanoarchaeota archaeon]